MVRLASDKEKPTRCWLPQDKACWLPSRFVQALRTHTLSSPGHYRLNLIDVRHHSSYDSEQ